MSHQLSPGCKLIITTGSGSTVTGVLHSFDESLGKVVLKKVTTSGSRLCGLQNFYFSDMTKLQIVKETRRSSTKIASLPDNNERNNVVPANPEMSVPQHRLEAETVNRDEAAMENINSPENGENRHVAENGESELLDEDADSSLLNVNDEFYETDYYTLIYRLGDKFYDAIDYILKQEAVGVAFEGVNIGRNGILSVIQISTDTDVIAFDILELGREAFTRGLQAVFESNNVVKVIHDCRWISDMLYEQFNIRMANVFDTQVANAYVYRILHGGKWPRYVESLPSCLVRHLKLQQDDVIFSKAKDGVPESPGLSPWLERPLPKQILSSAKKNVSYLTQLHQVLLNKMLYEFRMGVEIYMSHVRNMDGEVESCQKQGYLLPPIFWKIPELISLTCGDSKGQKDAKDDILGKDLPAPERVFLGHNLVRPKPKEPAYARDSDTQDKNVVKYDYEGNAYIVLDRKIDIDLLEDPGFTYNYFNNGSIMLDPDRLQKKNLKTQDETVCGDHQDLGLPSSNHSSQAHDKAESQKERDAKVEEFRQSDCSFSALVNKCNEQNNVSRHGLGQCVVLSQRESKAAGGCHTKENSSAVSDSADEGIKQNTLIQEQLKDSSSKYPSTHTSVKLGEDKNIILPTENTKLASKQPSSDADCGLHRSIVWQMYCANVAKNTELSSHIYDLGRQKEEIKYDNEQDLLLKTVPDKGTDSKIAMPKLVRVHHGTESADGKLLTESPDCDETHLSRSFHSHSSSSESESSLAHHSSQLNNSRGKDLDCSSCLPAGFHAVGTRKKKVTGQAQSHKSDLDLEYKSNNRNFLPESLEEDLCYIPMQDSLKGRQELPLGVTSFDFEDAASDSECSVQSPGKPQFCMDSHRGGHTDEDEDHSVCQFQNSEVFQKVLRMASSLPFENLKSKLLPSKVSVCGK